MTFKLPPIPLNLTFTPNIPPEQTDVDEVAQETVEEQPIPVKVTPFAAQA